MGPWTAQAPTGWSDWQTALRIVVKNLEAVGVDVSTTFPQNPVVTEAMINGNFELACWSVAGVGPASPWQRFRDVLDDRGVPDLGKPAFWNYGRFSSPAVPGLLDRAAVAASEEEAKQAFTELDAIFMANAPMIPLMYRPLEFYQYHEVNWVGFPNESNPYAPPMFSGSGNEWLFKIKRKGVNER